MTFVGFEVPQARPMKHVGASQKTNKHKQSSPTPGVVIHFNCLWVAGVSSLLLCPRSRTVLCTGSCWQAPELTPQTIFCEREPRSKVAQVSQQIHQNQLPEPTGLLLGPHNKRSLGAIHRPHPRWKLFPGRRDKPLATMSPVSSPIWETGQTNKPRDEQTGALLREPRTGSR